MHRDTIGIASLPASVTEYFAANQSKDTILKTFKNADSSVPVVSANDSLYANLFNASGASISRADFART